MPTASRKQNLLVILISPVMIIIQITLGVLLVQKIVQVDKAADDKSKLETYLRDNVVQLINAETGQRGYLLTGQPNYLEPYNMALVKLRENENYLSSFASKKQIRDLDQLHDRSKDKLNMMAMTIKLHTEGQHDSAMAVVKTGQGKMIMDSIRKTSDDYIDRLSKTMAADQQQEYRLVYIFLFSMGVLLLFHLFFWYYIYYRFNRYTKHILDLVDQLDGSNKYLEQFAYISAHDIKSPIITTQGLVNILMNSHAVKDEYANVTQMLKGTVDQMHRTNHALNNILKVRKNLLQRENMPDDLLPLQTIMNEVLATVQGDVELAKATVEVSIQTLADVSFPFVYIKSIFQNLLSNALKYRDANRPLVINTKAYKNNAGLYVFSIADNGIGIDLSKNKDKLYGIFRRFHDHVEGEGVGLHIVKSIVDAYGGNIDVASEPGVGTTFTITLPTIMENHGN